VVVAALADARTAVDALAGRGVATGLVVENADLTLDHPDGWAAAIEGVAGARGAGVVVGPGTERGNDLLARVAARMGRPFAANCPAGEPGERFRLTRQRWAGSLIEECWLDADVRILSVAPNTVAAATPDGSSAPSVATVAVALEPADLAVRVT